MEITGIALALLDVPAELQEDYNRWYDLDHLPEHVSKADVVMARRYVATAALRDAPGVQPSELTAGHPPYATIYFFGGPLDFAGPEALAGWQEMDRRIVKAGRYWKPGRAVYGSRWRVAAASARPSCLVAAPAVPHLAHRGVIVHLGRGPSAERRHEAVDWWEGTHLPDLYAVPGVLGAIRFDLADGEPSDLVLHVLLCEDEPGEVMAAIDEASRYWTALGRFPAHKGAYEPIAVLPYQRIVPLDYGFEV